MSRQRRRYYLETDQIQTILELLKGRGYRLIAPRLKDGAIVYDEIQDSADLPTGWTDIQDPGRYRVERRRDGAMFGYAVGPYSWKRFLHPPRLRLWQAKRTEAGIEFVPERDEPPNCALIGVRACELHAISRQDEILLRGRYADDSYEARRERCFIVGVNCTKPSAVCFCASMNTGPRVEAGFDLALTEVIEGGRHYFLIEEGSEAGSDLLRGLELRVASKPEQAMADDAVDRARQSMGRSLDAANIKALLYRNYEGPHWERIASRCLTCGNCTMVCPTCFCTTVEDVADLDGNNAERWRNWDSCFSLEFSHLHSASARSSPGSRYRQWMVHKLAFWIDQFGASGCVGCGRCITWCPVGIDITEEAEALRKSEAAGRRTRR